jgi:hypothetical protein
MTTDDIRQALKDALEPVTSSVKEMSGSFGKFQIETAVHLTEIRKDLKHVCDGHADLVTDVKELRENWPLVESHIEREENTASIKMAQAISKKSDPATPRPVDGVRLSTLSTWSIRLAPLILAAAIGLIGLGFYFASGSADEAVDVMREIRALADKTTKMSSEMTRIQAAIEDGGMK